MPTTDKCTKIVVAGPERSSITRQATVRKPIDAGEADVWDWLNSSHVAWRISIGFSVGYYKGHVSPANISAAAISSTQGIFWAFGRIGKIVRIRECYFGPLPDEKKTERDFRRFHPSIQQMAWRMIEVYANPIALERLDWPLLVYCAEAFDAIARHYHFNLDDPSLPPDISKFLQP